MASVLGSTGREPGKAVQPEHAALPEASGGDCEPSPAAVRAFARRLEHGGDDMGQAARGAALLAEQFASALRDRPRADRAPVHREVARVVAFGDAVFAITITLLVLEIRRPADDRNLLHSLLALWPSYLAYAVTFLFIGQVWANHHVMFDHIRAAVDPRRESPANTERRRRTVRHTSSDATARMSWTNGRLALGTRFGTHRHLLPEACRFRSPPSDSLTVAGPKTPANSAECDNWVTVPGQLLHVEYNTGLLAE